MATYTGHWPTLRDDGTTPADTGLEAVRFDERLATFHRRDMEVAGIFSFVGPANVRLPVVPRQTRFPKLP
jgi:hypothetical protein